MLTHRQVIALELHPLAPPRNAYELEWVARFHALDIAMLHAVLSVLIRVAIARAIESTRIGLLLPLSALNIGCAAWAFGSLLTPDVVQRAPPMAVAWGGILAMLAWSGFSAWWRRRGLDALLGA